MDPIRACVGGDVRPNGARFWGGGERLLQIWRNRGFKRLRAEFQCDDVAFVCSRSFAQLALDFEPMAFLAVRVERGAKGEAINGGLDGRHAPRGELRAGVLWQDQKGPGVGIGGFRRPKEFCGETDFRRRFGHFCVVVCRRRQKTLT